MGFIGSGAYGVLQFRVFKAGLVLSVSGLGLGLRCVKAVSPEYLGGLSMASGLFFRA